MTDTMMPESGEKPRVLVRRADFLAANKGLRVSRPGFVLLARRNEAQGLRFGITVTKKIGNAVVRNRMKRRLRALVRELLPAHGLAGHDHVLIGREGGIERDYAQMRAELLIALDRARAGKGDPPRRNAKPRPVKAADLRHERALAGREAGKSGAPPTP